MSGTVHNLVLGMPATAVIDNMFELDVRFTCRRVQGKLQGMVTAFDIFRDLLSCNSDASFALSDSQGIGRQ